MALARQSRPHSGLGIQAVPLKAVNSIASRQLDLSPMMKGPQSTVGSRMATEESNLKLYTQVQEEMPPTLRRRPDPPLIPPDLGGNVTKGVPLLYSKVIASGQVD